MRTSAAVLLATTALVQPAQAGPALLFIQGVGAAFGTAGVAGGAVATALGGAAAAGFTVGSFLGGTFLGRLVLSFGLSAISAALQPRPKVTSPSDRLANFAQPVSPFEYVVGRARKGGPYAVTAFNTDRRHTAVILAAHQIDAIEAWYLDGRRVVTDAATGEVTSAPYTVGSWSAGKSAVSLRPKLGAPGQTADATLVAGIAEWTSAHTMAGLAYVAAYFKRVADSRFSEVYGNSPPPGPAITPLMRGALVYDPRDGVTRWSDNAALVFAWIVTESLGGTVDWAQIAAEADHCDETVTNRDGDTQRRWTLNGSFDSTVDFVALAEQVMLACDGYVYEGTDGSIGLITGRWIEPTVTLTADDFLEFAVSENDFGPGAPTEFSARYIEPAADWVEAPSAVWVADPDLRAVRRDVAIWWSASHNQTMRCLKRIARVTRARWKLRARLGAIGHDLLETRFVRVRAHGWDFVLEIGSLAAGDDAATFVLQGHSVTPEDFAFDAATEEPAPPPRAEPSSDNVVPAPASVSGTAVAGPGIRWTWPAQPEGLTQELRLFIAAGFEPLETVRIRDGLTALTTFGVIDGASYRAELANVTSSERRSEFVVSGSVTALANATPPGPVTGLAVVVTGSDADLSWTTANDPAHAGVRICRADHPPAYGGPFDIADAALVATIYGPPNTAQTWQDAGLSSGVYAWWARAINSSGIESTAAGPVTEEI